MARALTYRSSTAGRGVSPRPRLSLLTQAVRGAREHNVTSLAAAVAYYAFLSIPSALLVVLGAFSLLAGGHAVSVLVERLGRVMPPQAVELLSSSLTRVTESRAGAGIAMIAVGTVLALWSLTGAMQTLIWALNLAHETQETRGFVRLRLTALAMLGCVVLALALSLGLLVLGPHLSRWLGEAVGLETAVRWIWWTAQWPVLVGGLLASFTVVLALGPVHQERRLRALTAGSVTAVVVWLAASGAFSLYLTYFGSYNKTWGTLAAVVITLTWLWLGSLALLIGAEIDAEAERRKLLVNR